MYIYSTPILPQQLLDQLKSGGRLFAVVGETPVMEARLVTCTAAGTCRGSDLFETDFPALRNAPRTNRFEF